MKKGFMTLLAVLILAAIGAIVSVSLFLVSVNSAQTASTFQEGEQAKALANTCAETALQKLVTLANYIGTGTVTVGSNSCSYTVITNGSLSDTINASATVGQSARKVKVSVTIPGLLISSWQEVSDF